MKKLLILFMLMGIVTAVNAQTSVTDRDIFTEQVIYSVNNFKLNSNKFPYNSISTKGFEELEESDHNPLQYIQQPADYISIASTSYDAVIIRIEVISEAIDGMELILGIPSDTASNQVDESDPKCIKIKKVKS